jgi:hypothetical protein
MAQGTLRYDPRTRKVEFSGPMRIAGIRFDQLPADLRAILEKPPHQAAVDAQGLPPTFRLATAGAPAAPRAQQPPVAERIDYTITANTPEPRLNRPTQRPPTYQITDRGLGYSIGNGLAEPQQGLHPGLKLVQFGAQVPAVGGQAPDIDRNPYNFVSFCGSQPWLEEKPHPDHSAWRAGCHSGILEFEATTLTPLFIPEGFPFKAEGKDDEARFLGIRRHFFRLPDADGQVRYAIPGSSLKGVLRSAVEALSNSRCGELNEKFYQMPIPYRRRVFENVGVLTRNASGQWEVERVDLLYVNTRDWPSGFRPPAQGRTIGYKLLRDRFKNFAVPGNDHTATAADILPFRANLLYAPAGNHRYSHVIVRRTGQRIAFAQGVVEKYEANLAHPHYDSHRRRYGSDPKHYAQPLDERLPLRAGDLVFFTLNGQRIDSFGKNVNYLWPSRFSVKDLVKEFFPKQDLSLEEPLSLAERMFGFSGRHRKNDLGKPVSHPYRGKIRIETCWGPNARSRAEEAGSAQHVELRLAPLTAPATRAKSRPLYLVGKMEGKDLVSSTYDDPKPEMKGRKFYWHQKADSGAGVWDKHLYDGEQHAEVDGQCPAPFHALKAGVTFTGRIHFDNLTAAELGCLLYGLEGSLAGGAGHALKIGKGKPRGLGSLQFRVTSLRTFDPFAYYRKLSLAPEETPDREALRIAFREWTSGHGKDDGHLRDFDSLHRLPSRTSVRYYPVNFSDYGWLPKPNLNPDRPNSGKYPRALSRPRDLPPE